MTHQEYNEIRPQSTTTRNELRKQQSRTG
uniref:Uncharacterized protein n=1 Tax=Arundo donax TaxID=35708 RepID=A0A0A9BMU7_ARUDO